MTVYTVALSFDKDGARTVYELQKQIADRCGNHYMIEQKMPPHITLAMFESESPPVDILREFAKTTAPIPLSFPTLGAFCRTPATLILLPVVSDALKEMHESLKAALGPVAALFLPGYVDPNWVPHCTLALYLGARERDAGMLAAMERFAPVKAQGVAVAVVEYPYHLDKGFLLEGGAR